MSDSLQLHRLQHARLSCPSLSPVVWANSCPLNQWCHTVVASSVCLFSSCPKFFPAPGSFPVSQFFASGVQSIGSASASILPTNTQGQFHLGVTQFDLLAVQGTLKSLLQRNNLNASVLQCSAFFMIEFLHPCMTIGKNHSFSYVNICWQNDVPAL